jgi:hypothetical protein
MESSFPAYLSKVDQPKRLEIEEKRVYFPITTGKSSNPLSILQTGTINPLHRPAQYLRKRWLEEDSQRLGCNLH